MDQQIPERHSKRREKVSWRVPVVPILLGVSKPDIYEPDTGLCSTSMRGLRCQIKCLCRYLDLCELSRELVKRISESLLPLLHQVIRQYLDYVCGVCFVGIESAIAALGADSVLQTYLDSVRREQRRQLHELEADRGDYHGWIAMTVYEVVYYSLADLAERKEIEFGMDFARMLTETEPLIETWTEVASKLAPSTLCYDLTHRVVGTTYSHWCGWKRLEAWEKDIRSYRIREDVRAACEQGLQEMKAKQDDIVAGAGGESDLFSRCGLAGGWWSADGQHFKHKDQCPVCQKWFRKARLRVPNQPKHLDALGAKRSNEYPWQCAEVDLLSKLIEFGYANEESAPAIEALCCNCRCF